MWLLLSNPILGNAQRMAVIARLADNFAETAHSPQRHGRFVGTESIFCSKVTPGGSPNSCGGHDAVNR